jgi:hypothetical protein
LLKPKYKNNKFASTPTSIISTELIKKYKPMIINRSEKKIISEQKNMDYGVISFEEIHQELNEYSLTSNRDLIEQFDSIGLSKIEFQIFLAIFDLFITNVGKDYEKPVYISLKDFHNHILDRKNRLRKNDIENYINVFNRLSGTIIKINTDNAIIYPYKKKFKNKTVNINCTIANIAVISIPEYDCDIIKISPTEYMLYEIRHIKQISNYLPRDFIKLTFRAHDNILFFGHYLTKMHKVNFKKGIKYSEWETSIPKLTENALPNYELFFEKFNAENKKGRYIDRTVLSPLKNALTIFKINNYIADYEFINIKKKFIFDSNQKLKIKFEYKI